MPTPTYTPLATVTLGTTAASVTFSSIPATYRDLILVIKGGPTTSADLAVQLNSDSGANYSRVYAIGNGTSALSGADSTGQWGAFATGTNNTLILQFMDYSATNKHKTVLSRFDSTELYAGMIAGRWANTAAVTTIALTVPSTTFVSASTFSLYGVIA
jgi:hypothetical protein